jgi:hypothetical protein
MPTENIDQKPLITESSQETTNSSAETTEEPSKLLSALEKERATRKSLEKQLKERTEAEQALQAKFEQYKQVDPDLYERLKKEQGEREEKDLLKRKEFEQLRQKYQSETEVALKSAKTWEERHNDVVIQTTVKNAFYETGGKRNHFDLSVEGGEDIAPVEAILALLRPRLKLENDKVVILNNSGQIELNSEGRPKTLGEKMLELKKSSMGSLFQPESNSSGSGMIPTITQNGQTIKVFSREQARGGKANIDDIASGKAFVN